MTPKSSWRIAMSSVKLNNLTPNNMMNLNQATKARQTVDTSFGAKLKGGLAATANIVGGAANMASAVVPGGTILSAALSGVGKASSSAAALTANTAQAPVSAAGTGGAGVASLPGSNGGAPSIPGTGNGAINSQFNDAKKMFEMQSAFNMQFLQLQTKMQHESRTYQTISNVMKNRTDTAKNSIRNIN